MFNNLFGNTGGSSNQQNTSSNNQPSMQKQNNPGTGTTTTGKTNNFADIWNEPNSGQSSNQKKEQPVVKPQ